jgi:hypothetical protein
VQRWRHACVQNQREAFRPSNYYYFLFINIYIHIFFSFVFRFPSCPETQFAPDVQRQAPVVFLSVFRIKFACLLVVNIAFAARRHLPPPLPTNCPLARLPVAPCHEQSRFPILFRAITKLLIKIHRVHNAHTTAVVTTVSISYAVLYIIPNRYINVIRWRLYLFKYKCSGMDYFVHWLNVKSRDLSNVVLER